MFRRSPSTAPHPYTSENGIPKNPFYVVKVISSENVNFLRAISLDRWVDNALILLLLLLLYRDKSVIRCKYGSTNRAIRRRFDFRLCNNGLAIELQPIRAR